MRVVQLGLSVVVLCFCFEKYRVRSCRAIGRRPELGGWAQLVPTGVFFVAFGGCEDSSKNLARQCIVEYNSIADQRAIHRVANRFMRPGSPIRQELECYAAGPAPLAHFPLLSEQLQEYSTALLVERRLEGEHRAIKQTLDKIGHNSSPAFLCSQVRLAHTKELLDTIGFQNFACSLWCNSIRFELLSHLMTKAQFAELSESEQLDALCLARVDMQYAKDLEAEQLTRKWVEQGRLAHCAVGLRLVIQCVPDRPA